ncbi:MAG: efflux RND transporter periplasmic adaptor subunit [Flavipsychrobacter sp.]|nr:efflux RND transporter periplasmic adaptor subunit [Flavipsychrobacter sp.]
MNLTYRILVLSLLTSTILVSGCSRKKEEPKGGGRPKMLTAQAYIVQPQNFSEEYLASGTLLPNEELSILPEISGRVTGIFFTEGARVRKGQKLLQLYSADITAQIQKLKTQRELQVKIRDRQSELVNIGGISRQDYETTQTQIESIDADIAFQEAQLRKTSIIAPFDGVVGIRNISMGAVISPSTIVTKLQQVHTLRMEFMLPDRYKNKIAKGKQVLFTINGSLDTLTGAISTIEPGADVTTRNFKVQAVVPNTKNELVPGSFAHVVIPFNDNSEALLIPSQSVIPTTKEKKAAVVKNGKAQLVTVVLGTRTSDKVEVISGLSAGDTILTTGMMQVKPGMDVKVSKITQ